MVDLARATSTLPPLIPEPCRVLILGSLPGEMSIRKREYYGNPGNRFWGAMQALGLVDDPRAPYAARIEALHGHSVGLWDVARSALRHRSSDASMRDVDPNPIPTVVATRGIRALFFNGTTARGLFDHFFRGFDAAPVTTLPSTSGSNVQWWVRRDEWRAILAYLDPGDAYEP